jgi:hypothetical protein
MTRSPILLFAQLAILSSSTFGCEEGFEPLFDGQTLSGWSFVGIGPENVRVEEGIIKCDGQPNGYIYRDEVYRNFVLKLQFRFARPPTLPAGQDDQFWGNSGYFVYVQEPHQVWPEALEVQGAYRDTGDIFGLPWLTSGNDAPDATALSAARRAVGEWNELRITSQDGALEVNLNGHVVNRSTPGSLSEGAIALQSEGAEIHWRDVAVRRLP